MLMVSVCLSATAPQKVYFSSSLIRASANMETIEQFRLREVRETENRNERAQVRETVRTRHFV